MTKTIEEAAKAYAEFCMKDYDGDPMHDVAIHDRDAYYGEAIEVLSWLFAKPLASRMITEEKERVRKMYKRMVVDVENSDSYNCIPASDMDNGMETLESIFGSDFFKEGE